MAHQFEQGSLLAELSHDGGHSLISMALALALTWFGMSDGWATVWAAGVLPLVLELRDMAGLGGLDPRRWRLRWPVPSADNVRDFATYAGPLTTLYFLTHGPRIVGLSVAVVTVVIVAMHYRRQGFWGTYGQ